MKDSISISKDSLYSEFYPKVLGYMRSRITDYHDAEDLAEDVFVKIYNNWDKFDGKLASVSTWIYTIARNTLTDYFRTRKTYADIDSIVEPVSGDDGPEDVTVGNETTEELAFALEKLDENERDLIIMCYFHGMKLIDTAEKMHVTYSQAKRIRNKALLKMRQYIPCEYSAVPAEAVN